MTALDIVYQFCLNEYQFYINSYEKYKDDTKMADLYLAKANAFVCVMRVLEVMQDKDLFS